jgi:hypothetical protein
MTRLLAALLALLLSCAAQAGALVPFTDFTPQGTQPDLQYELRGSNGCLGCHGGATQNTHYPRNSWAGSMMANATRDPLFWAALDVANADGAANGAAGIGDYCLRCHTPKGWFGGRVRKKHDVQPQEGLVDAADLVDGADGCLLQGEHDRLDEDANDYGGVGCSTCHRLLPNFAQSESALTVDDVACEGFTEPCRGGPYDDYPVPIDEFNVFPAPPHAWKHSAYQSGSEACGSCHDVSTPITEAGPFRTLIENGSDTGLPFPAERTYSEWKASAFANVLFADGMEQGGAEVPGVKLARGQTCQGCHMPQAEGAFEQDEPRVCSFGPEREGNLRTHQFAGGNTWVPAILKGEFPALGRGDAFDNTVAWAQRMLSERSALVSATARRNGNTLTATVRVTNLAGHKLPTGYAEGRRMWLALEVRGAGNALLWSNGAWNPATGELQRDAQTRVYETKQGRWDASTGICRTTDEQGRERFHFVLNDCIAKDNRIPPLGFTGGADPSLAPRGASFAGNVDVATYAIPLSADAAGPFTLRATLRHQVASKEYVEFLRNQALERGFAAENALCAGGPGRPFDTGPQDKSRGQYVFDLWSSPSYGRSPPEDMASSTAVVQ